MSSHPNHLAQSDSGRILVSGCQAWCLYHTQAWVIKCASFNGCLNCAECTKPPPLPHLMLPSMLSPSPERVPAGPPPVLLATPPVCPPPPPPSTSPATMPAHFDLRTAALGVALALLPLMMAAVLIGSVSGTASAVAVVDAPPSTKPSMRTREQARVTGSGRKKPGRLRWSATEVQDRWTKRRKGKHRMLRDEEDAAQFTY